MTDAQYYRQKYIADFNVRVTDFRNTPRGPIAKVDGKWFSVNGVKGDIQDVRYDLDDRELVEHGVTNDR